MVHIPSSDVAAIVDDDPRVSGAIAGLNVF